MATREWSGEGREPGQDRAGGWRTDLLYTAVVAVAIAIVHAPSIGTPPRNWLHLAVILLAKAPQFDDGLFWHLVHYREFVQENVIYFRVLSMPVTWGLARLFQDHTALYHGAHLLAHFGVSAVLYRLAAALGCPRLLSLLIALLFALFSGHGDTADIPLYTFMFVALVIAGFGLLFCIRHLRRGDTASLIAGEAALVLATLLYEAFFLAAIGFPLVSLVRRWRAPAATRRDRVAVAGVLAAALLVFAGVVASQKFAPKLQVTPGAGTVTLGVSATLGEILRLHQVGWGAWYAVWGLLTDAQVFLTGHRPEVWHRGNMPYWDLGSVARIWRDVQLALLLLLGGVLAFRVLRGSWRLAGIVLVLAGAAVDPRSALLAALVVLLLPLDLRSLAAPAVLLTTVAALAASLTVAVARPDGYSVAALRHHYVGAFFVLLVLAAALGAGWAARPRWQRAGLPVVLALCLGLNAWATVRLLDDVAKGNARVFAFDRALGDVAERQGPGTLFLGFSTSSVTGLDWHGWPALDVAFDVLHFHRNPMTRHVNRAPILVQRDGFLVPNRFYRLAPGQDFRFQFRLVGVPHGRYELFGASPREPRVVLDGGMVLRGRRRTDAQAVEWRFPFPPGTLFPAVVSLSRVGRTLHFDINGRPAAAAVVAEESEYAPWESDNAGLLGRDFERLLLMYALYDSYMRVGRAPGADL